MSSTRCKPDGLRCTTHGRSLFPHTKSLQLNHGSVHNGSETHRLSAENAAPDRAVARTGHEWRTGSPDGIGRRSRNHSTTRVPKTKDLLQTRGNLRYRARGVRGGSRGSSGGRGVARVARRGVVTAPATRCPSTCRPSSLATGAVAAFARSSPGRGDRTAAVIATAVERQPCALSKPDERCEQHVPGPRSRKTAVQHHAARTSRRGGPRGGSAANRARATADRIRGDGEPEIAQRRTGTATRGSRRRLPGCAAARSDDFRRVVDNRRRHCAPSTVAPPIVEIGSAAGLLTVCRRDGGRTKMFEFPYAASSMARIAVSGWLMGSTPTRLTMEVMVPSASASTHAARCSSPR